MKKFLLQLWDGWKQFNMPILCEIEQEERECELVTLPPYR